MLQLCAHPQGVLLCSTSTSVVATTARSAIAGSEFMQQSADLASELCRLTGVVQALITLEEYLATTAEARPAPYGHSALRGNNHEDEEAEDVEDDQDHHDGDADNDRDLGDRDRQDVDKEVSDDEGRDESDSDVDDGRRHGIDTFPPPSPGELGGNIGGAEDRPYETESHCEMSRNMRQGRVSGSRVEI